MSTPESNRVATSTGGPKMDKKAVSETKLSTHARISCVTVEVRGGVRNIPITMRRKKARGSISAIRARGFV